MTSAPALEFVVKSSHADKQPTAAVIWLHGLGADGHDFAGIVPELHLPDNMPTRFIFPHAPVQPVTMNGGIPMPAWFDIRDVLNLSEIDEDGLLAMEQNIRDLIEAQIEDGIPSNRIFLAGFSQGGALALFTAMRFDQPLAGIVALSTFLPMVSHVDLADDHPNRHIPIFMAHGTQDPLVGLSLGQTTAEALKAQNHPLEWKTYPMEHSVCPEEINDISRFLQKNMPQRV